MNILTDFLTDILKFTVAGVIVFYIAWLQIREVRMRTPDSALLDLKKAALSTTLPLRLQAYERMALLIERITPANLLLRLHVPGATAAESHAMLIAEIRNEYQHNVAQQVYINKRTWTLITKLKEDTITLINNTARTLPAEASAVDLSRSVLINIAEIGENPYEAALTLIKEDLQHLFY